MLRNNRAIVERRGVGEEWKGSWRRSRKNERAKKHGVEGEASVEDIAKKQRQCQVANNRKEEPV